MLSRNISAQLVQAVRDRMSEGMFEWIELDGCGYKGYFEGKELLINCCNGKYMFTSNGIKILVDHQTINEICWEISRQRFQYAVQEQETKELLEAFGINTCPEMSKSPNETNYGNHN